MKNTTGDNWTQKVRLSPAMVFNEHYIPRAGIIYIYKNIYIYTFRYICVYTSMFKDVSYRYIYIYIYIYIYVHIYIGQHYKSRTRHMSMFSLDCRSAAV